jgi:orotate phosphoribosyltransferase
MAFYSVVFDKKGLVYLAMDNDVVGFGNVVLNSGRESHWYVDWEKVGNDVFLVNQLARYVIEFVKDRGLEPRNFMGARGGASKIGVITQNVWAQSCHDYGRGSHVLPMMRAVSKRHGKTEDRYFVGAPTSDLVVLEDVTSSGITLRDAVTTVFDYKEGGPVGILAAVSITDRSEGEAENVMACMDVPFHAMTTTRDLLGPALVKYRPSDVIKGKLYEEFQALGVEDNPISPFM